MDIKLIEMYLWGIIDPIAVGYHLERQSFLIRLQALGASEDQAQSLYSLICEAATRQLASNAAFIAEALPRVQQMYVRGDSYEQVMAWVKALPQELLIQLDAETFFGLNYPGGPGRVFGR